MAKVLTVNSSKDEELTEFHNFASRCLEGSYLRSLFTKDFMTWVKNKIEDDVCPDMMEYLAATNIELLECKKLMNSCTNECSELVKKLGACEEQLKQVCNARSESENRFHKLVTDLDKLAFERKEEIDHLEALLMVEETKVISLKVKLFDLQNPE